MAGNRTLVALPFRPLPESPASFHLQTPNTDTSYDVVQREHYALHPPARFLQPGRGSVNRIRHELIPFLAQVMQRPVRSQLAHAAELLRAEAEFVEAAESALGPLPEQLEVEAMRALPLALQRRRMFRWLSERGIPELSFELVDAALSLLTRRQPAKHNLPGGSHVRRRNGVIFCEPPLLRRGIQKDAS